MLKSLVDKVFSLLRFIIPPKIWRVPVIIMMGAVVGLGAYIFVISRAGSYLTDDPKTCINCHIMGPQYSGWFHSSHKRHATCNDCHVPQDNLLRHYFFKAKDGSRHAAMFTFHMEPQAIRIHEVGQKVVQENCKRCHTNLLSQTHLNRKTDFSNEKRCWSCHRYSAHGKSRSLSSVPYARIPTTSSMVPAWLKEMMTEEEK